MNIQDAIILSAAEGKSMLPITEVVPKYLMTIAGKSMLEHWFDRFEEAEVQNLNIALSHKAKQIEKSIQFFQNKNLNITTYSQKKYIGTGNSLYNCLPNVSDEFIITIGDRLLLNNFSSIIKTMKSIWNPQKMDTLFLMESEDKIKKKIEIKFYLFPIFRKITVGGFVNQLIKNSGLTNV